MKNSLAYISYEYILIINNMLYYVYTQAQLRAKTAKIQIM